MAENESPQGEQGAETQEPQEQKETDWKAEARKWESRAKENQSVAKTHEAAAKRLAEIEESNKSEAQKSAEALAAAQRVAAEAEAKVIRRDVALEHKLAPADAALLDTITDEDTMRALAARLATTDEPSGPRAPKPDANQGTKGGNTASAGDQFAGFFTNQLGG